MLKEILHKSKRVLKVARKPDKSEYLNVAKVTGIGILIIGMLGFIIYMVKTLAVGGLA